MKSLATQSRLHRWLL